MTKTLQPRRLNSFESILREFIRCKYLQRSSRKTILVQMGRRHAMKLKQCWYHVMQLRRWYSIQLDWPHITQLLHKNRKNQSYVNVSQYHTFAISNNNNKLKSVECINILLVALWLSSEIIPDGNQLIIHLKNQNFDEYFYFLGSLNRQCLSRVSSRNNQNYLAQVCFLSCQSISNFSSIR